MDELNDMIAAMPDGATLTVQDGATYRPSGAIRIIGKRDFTLKLAGATIVLPPGFHVDFAGSLDCRVDFNGSHLVTEMAEGAGAGYGLTAQEPEAPTE